MCGVDGVCDVSVHDGGGRWVAARGAVEGMRLRVGARVSLHCRRVQGSDHRHAMFHVLQALGLVQPAADREREQASERIDRCSEGTDRASSDVANTIMLAVHSALAVWC